MPRRRFLLILLFAVFLCVAVYLCIGGAVSLQWHENECNCIPCSSRSQDSASASSNNNQGKQQHRVTTSTDAPENAKSDAGDSASSTTTTQCPPVPECPSVSSPPQQDDKSPSPVYISYVFSGKLLPQFSTALNSLLQNSELSNIPRLHFIIVTSKGSEKKVDSVFQCVGAAAQKHLEKENNRFTVPLVDQISWSVYGISDKESFGISIPQNSVHHQALTYLNTIFNYIRLYMPHLLKNKPHLEKLSASRESWLETPRGIPRKVLYTDVDIIILSDIASLYDSHLLESAASPKPVFAMVYRDAKLGKYGIEFSHEAIKEWNKEHKEEQIRQDHIAYNNGFFIMDLVQMQEINFQARMEYWMKANKKKKLYVQATNPLQLLSATNAHIEPMPPGWNTEARSANTLHIAHSKALHWNGGLKPWKDAKAALKGTWDYYVTKC